MNLSNLKNIEDVSANDSMISSGNKKSVKDRIATTSMTTRKGVYTSLANKHISISK